MEQVEEIELNFDPQINIVMIRYVQLHNTLDYLVEHKAQMDSDVMDFAIDSVTSEIEHIQDIMKKVYYEHKKAN